MSSIRMITEHHSSSTFEQTEVAIDWPDTVGAQYAVAETDGGMLPVVTIDPKAKDKRQGNWDGRD